MTNMGKVEFFKGKVVAAGVGNLISTGVFVDNQHKVGDIVFFPSAHAMDFKFNGKRFYIIRDDDAIGKVEE